MKEKLTIQLITACLVTLGGMILLFWGCSIDPEGQIHDSLLVAFGEAMTFAGALFGVDYTYRFRRWKHDPENKNDKSNNSNQ